MPAIHVPLDQPIRLLERKQIEHQIAQRRRVADPLVENARVARREHAVCPVCEVGNEVYDCVAQTLDAEPVREAIQVEQRVVCWLPVFEGRGNRRRVQPRDEQLEMVWADVFKGDGFGC